VLCCVITVVVIIVIVFLLIHSILFPILLVLVLGKMVNNTGGNGEMAWPWPMVEEWKRIQMGTFVMKDNGLMMNLYVN
jgi:hypothetical protein